MLQENLPKSPKDTISLYYRINPRDICYLTGIFDAYPGFATLRTDDPKKGLIQLWVSPDFYEEVLAIMQDLQEEISLTPLDS